MTPRETALAGDGPEIDRWKRKVAEVERQRDVALKLAETAINDERTQLARAEALAAALAQISTGSSDSWACGVAINALAEDMVSK